MRVSVCPDHALIKPLHPEPNPSTREHRASLPARGLSRAAHDDDLLP
jgi:hypothetical protein